MPSYGTNPAYVGAKAFLVKIFRPSERFPAGSSAREFIVISQAKTREGARGHLD